MILTCPHCETRYTVSENALEPEGRKVKCTECEEVWFQTPEENSVDSLEEGESNPESGSVETDSVDREFEEVLEDISGRVEPVSDDHSPPSGSEESEFVIHPRARLHGYMGALLVFVVLTVGLFVFQGAIIRAFPSSFVFYDLFGSPHMPGEGIVFDKVKVKLGEEGIVNLEGEIINLTPQEARVPPIEVSIKSATGDTLDHWIIQPDVPYLSGEGAIAFSSARYVSDPDSAVFFLRFDLSATGEEGGSGQEDHLTADNHNDH